MRPVSQGAGGCRVAGGVAPAAGGGGPLAPRPSHTLRPLPWQQQPSLACFQSENSRGCCLACSGAGGGCTWTAEAVGGAMAACAACCADDDGEMRWGLSSGEVQDASPPHQLSSYRAGCMGEAQELPPWRQKPAAILTIRGVHIRLSTGWAPLSPALSHTQQALVLPHHRSPPLRPPPATCPPDAFGHARLCICLAGQPQLPPGRFQSSCAVQRYRGACP